jgi:hypothetical protein
MLATAPLPEGSEYHATPARLLKISGGPVSLAAGDFQAAFPTASKAARAGEGRPGPWRAQQFLYSWPELQGHGAFRGGAEADSAFAECPVRVVQIEAN